MPRSRRHAALATIALLASAGCSSTPAVERTDVKERTESVQAAATTIMPAVGEAVGVTSYSSSGQARWLSCGSPPSPTGAEYVAEVSITGTTSVASTYADSIVTALDSQGWTIDSSTADVIEAHDDEHEFTARYEGGLVRLMLTAPCLDLSGDDVETLGDLPSADLGLTATPPPGG